MLRLANMLRKIFYGLTLRDRILRLIYINTYKSTVNIIRIKSETCSYDATGTYPPIGGDFPIVMT